MTESLTYSQLGERLSISPEAARALAIRRRWPRTRGNDGKARVAADLSDISHTPATRPASARLPELLERVEALQVELANATRVGVERRTDYERERDRGDRLLAELLKLQGELMAERARPWWRRRRAA